MNTVTRSTCAAAEIRTFDLRGNNYNRVSIHRRLGRANSERAAEQMSGAFLIPPSLTLGNSSRKNRNNTPTKAVNRSPNYRITDALAILRSSKRRKYSNRNYHANVDRRQEDEEDNHDSSKKQQHQLQTLVSDESDQSVGSVENHHIRTNDDAQEIIKIKSSQKASPAIVGPSKTTNNIAAHMDSNWDWTIGILPPAERNPSRIRRDPILTDLSYLTSLSSEFMEAQERGISPRYR